MRIGLTGGGTGGHFYPLIAVSEELRILARENNIPDLEIYYFGPSEYDEGALRLNNIIFKRVSAGKKRNYFSLLNYLDVFKTLWGSIIAVGKVFWVYPDVMFSKGGFASIPVLIACRILFIPVFIHESDSIPGRGNKWAGKFAKRIAVSFPAAIEYFKNKKITAHTGHPIRNVLMQPLKDGSHIFFGTDSTLPTIAVLGGSQGAEIINNIILDALPDLISRYNIIHQTGKNNLLPIQKTTEIMLQNSDHKNRYAPFGFMDTETLRRVGGVADLVITRAGSTIFEIASWGVPAIVIPITHSANDHQKKNAFLYAQSGAGSVIGENNLTEHILLAEIEHILGNKDVAEKMKQEARAFNNPQASRIIAREIIELALGHEQIYGK